MTVGTPQEQNFESMSGTAYKTAIDNNMAACKVVAAAYAPYAKTFPDMNVLVHPGSIFVNNTLVTNVQQIFLFTAPSSNPRIDRIVRDKLTGVASVVAGSESGSPTPPGIPAGKSPIAQVALAVGMTAITNANIIDERIGGADSSSTTEVSFPVAIDTGETTTALAIPPYVTSNTADQIVVSLAVAGFTGGTGGKFGTHDSNNTVSAEWIVGHSLGSIQMVTAALSTSSAGSNPFTGTLKIAYK